MRVRGVCRMSYVSQFACSERERLCVSRHITLGGFAGKVKFVNGAFICASLLLILVQSINQSIND